MTLVSTLEVLPAGQRRSNNEDCHAAKSANLDCWMRTTTVSQPLHERRNDTQSSKSCPPWHYNNIRFMVKRPRCHCSKESRTCTELDSYPCLSPSATSRGYVKVLHCLYSTVYGVLQCSVVWRISRITKVAGESAAKSCWSHCSRTTWVRRIGGALLV